MAARLQFKLTDLFIYSSFPLPFPSFELHGDGGCTLLSVRLSASITIHTIHYLYNSNSYFGVCCLLLAFVFVLLLAFLEFPANVWRETSVRDLPAILTATCKGFGYVGKLREVSASPHK